MKYCLLVDGEKLREFRTRQEAENYITRINLGAWDAHCNGGGGHPPVTESEIEIIQKPSFVAKVFRGI